MKLEALSLTLAAALALSACGETGPDPSETTSSDTSMNHDSHRMDGGVGHAQGTVVSVAEGELGIDHGPIEGIGMDAMTMRFETVNDVDATAFAAGDEVSFMVKRGRDGTYRITAICDTDRGGVDCLDSLMSYER